MESSSAAGNRRVVRSSKHPKARRNVQEMPSEPQPQPGCQKGSARVCGVGGGGCGSVATAGWIEGSTLQRIKLGIEM